MQFARGFEILWNPVFCFIVFVGCVLASNIFYKTSDLGQILMKDSAPACVSKRIMTNPF